jgi:hypothetical protein
MRAQSGHLRLVSNGTNRDRGNMNSKSVAIHEKNDFGQIENVLIAGDLSKLTEEQRLTYFYKVCESVGLNPLTRPFEYMTFQGKTILYARKDATEQLRNLRNVAITKLERELIDDVFIITATAQLPNGRTDSSTGAVTVGHLKGEAKANAMMKAETKAKRRVTLSICGLGLLDESEAEDMMKQTKDFDQQKSASKPIHPSDAQLRRLFAISKQFGVTEDQLKDRLVSKLNKTSTKDLTIEEYNEICEDIQSGKFTVVNESLDESDIKDASVKPETNPNELPWAKYMNDPQIVK